MATVVEFSSEPLIVCECYIGGRGFRKTFRSSLEWFVAAADRIAECDSKSEDWYVTLSASPNWSNTGESQEVHFTSRDLDRGMEEIEEVCAELFEAARDRVS